MELLLWRHAEAEEGAPDMERLLTARGEQQAAKVAAFLRTRVPKNTRILVSPAARAQQTASALTRHFEIVPAIGPGSTPKTVLEAANWPSGEGSVMIVGHQPYLGEIAASLLAEGAAGFSIKKGAAWWFTRRDEEIYLHLVITPDLA